MHTYEPTRRQPYLTSTIPAPIPSMRPAQEPIGGHSATPIYDELYSEYRSSFKALPGDRSGEEHLGFTGFATGPYGTHPHHHETRHGGWYPVASVRPHGPGTHVPAALPPAPRSER
ncbi:hypothetical protein ACWCP6_33785 [Streptomyces sp. NPDC002004]